MWEACSSAFNPGEVYFFHSFLYEKKISAGISEGNCTAMMSA